MTGMVVVDGRRIVDIEAASAAGLRVVALGVEATGAALLPALIALLTLSGGGFGTAFAETAKGGEWKDITLVYTSDVVGKIDPCG